MNEVGGAGEIDVAVAVDGDTTADRVAVTGYGTPEVRGVRNAPNTKGCRVHLGHEELRRSQRDSLEGLGIRRRAGRKLIPDASAAFVVRRCCPRDIDVPLAVLGHTGSDVGAVSGEI